MVFRHPVCPLPLTGLLLLLGPLLRSLLNRFAHSLAVLRVDHICDLGLTAKTAMGVMVKVQYL